MRIYDSESKRALKSVTLFLTPQETDELGQSSSDLAKNHVNHHHHVSDKEFKREIIVAVYTGDNATEFDAESQKVIGTDC